MGSEKRSSQRKEYHGTVRVYELKNSRDKSPAETEGQSLHLTGVNISQQGICLKTEYFFIPDHLFELDFSVMHKTIHTLARVVWSEKNACGLQFLRPEDVSCIFTEEPVESRET